MKNYQKANRKANSPWQKTKYANLVRNISSGNYFARFRNNGKLIWRSLDTDVFTIAAQRLPDKITRWVQCGERSLGRTRGAFEAWA